MARKKATQSKKKQGKPSPQCKAILLCDMAIVEGGTNKPSVIGIFDRLYLRSVPGHLRPCFVFLQLISGIGHYEITIEVHDLGRDRVLARAKVEDIEFADRMTGINVVIPVPALPLSHVGAYDFVVMADGQEIDRQQFLAALADGEGETDGADPDEEESDE